jgi:hypothetical protein
VVNQACDYPGAAAIHATTTTATSSAPRAYALRGATYISQLPNGKTKIVMLQHANCGYDIPEWAVRTAVNILAPIKPFEIIHRIQVGVKRSKETLEREEGFFLNAPATSAHAECDTKRRRRSIQKQKKNHSGVDTDTTFGTRRSRRPAGIAQMGCACFWPEGGGLVEE